MRIMFLCRYSSEVAAEEARIERDGLGENVLVTEGTVLAARMDAGLYHLFMVLATYNLNQVYLTVPAIYYTNHTCIGFFLLLLFIFRSVLMFALLLDDESCCLFLRRY